MKKIYKGMTVFAIIVELICISSCASVANKGGQPQVVVPISDEYTVQREILDWYTSLGAIRTKSSDKVPASVVVDIALGYKKDDKATFKEITQRNIELKDFLRRYFTKKTAAQLRPQNENNLKIELKNAINNKILSSSKIEDISFLQLDVVEQQ